MATRTARLGNGVEMEISVVREMRPTANDCDGDKIVTKRPVAEEKIVVRDASGKVLKTAYTLSYVKAGLPGGSVAVAGNIGLSAATWAIVEPLQLEAEAEGTTDEYRAWEASQAVQETPSHVCPRCGTYCCGDCRA